MLLEVLVLTFIKVKHYASSVKVEVENLLLIKQSLELVVLMQLLKMDRLSMKEKI